MKYKRSGGSTHGVGGGDDWQKKIQIQITDVNL